MTNSDSRPLPLESDIDAPEPIPSPVTTPAGTASADNDAGFAEFVWELLQTLVMAGLLIVFFRTFVFQNYVVEGNSMQETLHPEERVIVGRLNYILGEPQRGDIVVFEYPLDTSRDYVKRIIGMPGETVSIRNNQVYIDGQPLGPETYLTYTRMNDFGPVSLGADEYFVLGDNRPGSSDSRSWGALNKRFIIGKAWLVYFPFNHFRILTHPDIEPGQ